MPPRRWLSRHFPLPTNLHHDQEFWFCFLDDHSQRSPKLHVDSPYKAGSGAARIRTKIHLRTWFQFYHCLRGVSVPTQPICSNAIECFVQSPRSFRRCRPECLWMQRIYLSLIYPWTFVLRHLVCRWFLFFREALHRERYLHQPAEIVGFWVDYTRTS